MAPESTVYPALSPSQGLSRRRGFWLLKRILPHLPHRHFSCLCGRWAWHFIFAPQRGHVTGRVYNGRMSQSTPLPSEERVRELTADPDLAPEDANRYGNLFAEAGKHPQAIMFCERTKDPQVLGRVKEHAVRSGDAFLLHSITRLVADFVKEGEWMECGEKALAEGKFLFARDCFEKAGSSEKATAAHDEWLKIFKDEQAPPPAPTSEA